MKVSVPLKKNILQLFELRQLVLRGTLLLPQNLTNHLEKLAENF